MLILFSFFLTDKPLPKLTNSTQNIFNTLISGDFEQTLDPTPEDLDFLGETSSAYTSEPVYDDYSENALDNDYSIHAAEELDSEEFKTGNASVISPPRDLKAVIVKHRFVTLTWEEPEHKLEEVTGYAILYKVKGSER